MKKYLLPFMALLIFSTPVFSTPVNDGSSDFSEKADQFAEKTWNTIKLVGEALGQSVEEVGIATKIQHDGISLNLTTQGSLITLEDDFAQVTNRFGVYNIDIDVNLLSNDDFLALNEAFVVAIENTFYSDLGEIRIYNLGYRAERIEGRDVTYYTHDISIAGAEYRLNFVLDDSKKIRLILSGGAELGYVTEATGDGLYARLNQSMTIQLEKLFITYFVKGKSTFATQLDHANETTTSYSTIGFDLTYQLNSDVSFYTGFNISSTGEWEIPLGVKMKLGNRKRD